MKTFKKTTTLALALATVFGITTLSFAGNHPALTYPQGAVATSDSPVQMAETNPWHKNTLKYASGAVVAKPWYTTCPVSHVAFNSKHPGAVVTLSNGKLILLASAVLKGEVEANPGKYEAYMYGSGIGDRVSEIHMADAANSTGNRKD
jgi:glucose/arabinose dehydrogenase